MKTYKKYFKSGKLKQIARIVYMLIGKYAFETSLLGTQPFELNINMPMFNTEAEAMQWIEGNPDWNQAKITESEELV